MKKLHEFNIKNDIIIKNLQMLLHLEILIASIIEYDAKISIIINNNPPPRMTI